MNCQVTQQLIHGYLDDELDLTKCVEIDQHLQQCPACAQAYTDLQALRTAIKEGAPYFSTPSHLHDRIRSTVRMTSKSAPATHPGPWRVLAIAASAALILIAGWGLARVFSIRSAVPLTQELFANHVRSEMLPEHRFDITSSNQHVVKPWFEGKLDFSPAVKDLADHGFRLAGGRLEYLDGRPVAALVYYRRDHLINLFIWPTTPASQAVPKTVTRQGYHLIHWTQADMNYWAVSNLNETELQDFVRLIQE